MKKKLSKAEQFKRDLDNMVNREEKRIKAMSSEEFRKEFHLMTGLDLFDSILLMKLSKEYRAKRKLDRKIDKLLK